MYAHRNAKFQAQAPSCIYSGDGESYRWIDRYVGREKRDRESKEKERERERVLVGTVYMPRDYRK